MRAEATMILAPHVGQTLTAELASSIVAKFPLGGRPVDLSLFQPEKCGRLVFNVERMRAILDELEPLHAEHWKETESYQAGTALDPLIEEGLLDEQVGRLIQITARDRDTGRLVGNARMYLGRSRHTRRRIATEDTIYLLPDYRVGRAGLRLVEYTELSCWRAGAQDCYMDDKVKNPAAGKILAFLGYEHIANRRFKNLEKHHVRT